MSKKIIRPVNGKLREVKVDRFGDKRFDGQTSAELSFRNETLNNLVIVFRSGVRVYLDRAMLNQFATGCLIIRHGITNSVASGVKVDVVNQHIAGEPITDPIIEAWRSTLGIYRDPNAIPEPFPARGEFRSRGILSYLDQTEIRRYNGAVYLREFDILVCINDGTGREIPPHPYSKLGQLMAVESEIPSATGSGVSFRIIDRFMKFGSRYYNAAGHIVFVQSEEPVDAQLEDGVYMTIDTKAPYNRGELVTRTFFFSFEDANKQLPLFFSELEARTLGNPDDIYKKELERQKFEIESEKSTYKLKLAREEADVSQLRHQFEKEKSLWEAEQERREHEFRRREHDMKSEQIMLKYRLDEKSEHRKAWLEIIKYVPAVIGGIITVATVISKLKESKSDG